MSAQGGLSWTPEATTALILEVESSPHRSVLMMKSRRPRMHVWEAMQTRMAQRGYRLEVPFLRSKWKRLKSAFYIEREYRAEHGIPSVHSPSYYELMFRVWQRAERSNGRGGQQAGTPNCRHQIPPAQRCLAVARRSPRNHAQLLRQLAGVSRRLSEALTELRQLRSVIRSGF